ncbi:unnamed protein product [Brassica oleracea var. botrytis]
MGLRKLSRPGCTQLCRNWVLIMVIPSQTIRLHRYWLTRVTKDANALKRLSSDRYLLQSGRLRRKLIIKSVINFVQRDIGEMFPKWEFDAEDTPAENIIKLMFVKRPWKWTMDCWEEIKHLSKRVEAVEKKVGITTKRKGISSQNTETWTSAQNTIPPPKPTLEPGLHLLCFLYVRTCVLCLYVNGTNAGRKSLPEDKDPDVPADASSSKDKAPEPSLVLKLAASQQSPYTANNMAKVIIPNKKLYPHYNPFAPIDKKKLKELADWLITCPHCRTLFDKKPHTSRTWWYHILRTSLEWLKDCHIDAWINALRKRYDANPQHFKSERMTRSPIRTHYTIILPIEQVVWDNICSIKKNFVKPNGKTMRDKMAVVIFKELSDAHEFKNKDNDANLGAYEG